MPSNEFFMFYYMLTGVHLFHVGLGLLILGIVVRELRNPRRRRMSMVESGATYWHMVDLLWIVIFAPALRDEVTDMMTTDRPATRTTTTYVWLILSASRSCRGGWPRGMPRRAGGSQRADHRRRGRCWASSRAGMIIRYFMEVRTAPRWLKLTTDAWLTVLWAGDPGDLPVLTRCGPAGWPVRPRRMKILF